MRTKSRHSIAGASLLESVLAIAMLGVVAGSIGLVSRTSSSAMSTTSAVSRGEERSRRTTNLVLDLLGTCGRDSLTPQVEAPVGTSQVEFVRMEGTQAGVAIWGPLERFELQEDPADLDDGMDDDGDGFIDEKILVRIINPGDTDESSYVIGRNIAEYLEGEIANGIDDNGNGLIDEPGFCLTFDGFLMTMHMTVLSVTPDGIPITTTSTRDMALLIPGP